MLFFNKISSVIGVVALLGRLSGAVDSDSVQVPIQPNAPPAYYLHIRSADGYYVQASGVLQPLKLVPSKNRNTLWYLAYVGTSGYATLQSVSGWHASAPGNSTDGPVVEDPSTATHWDITVVTSQFLTISTRRSHHYWTTHRGSDEIWLDKEDRGSASQAWRFFYATNATDME